jgi:hypothetical protein
MPHDFQLGGQLTSGVRKQRPSGLSGHLWLFRPVALRHAGRVWVTRKFRDFCGAFVNERTIDEIVACTKALEGVADVSQELRLP